MKKIKALFAVAALIISTTVAMAQNIRVTGVVTERGGDAINGAAVQLKGSATVYAMTDANGNSALWNRQDDAWTIPVWWDSNQE